MAGIESRTMLASTPRKLTVVALGVALLVLPACASHDGSHSSSPTATSAAMVKSPATADAAFASGMIPHHESAVEMSQIALSRAEHPEVKSLARAIIAAQKGEIAELRSIGRSLPQGAGSGHDGHGGMSDEEMGMTGDVDSLKTARPFDKAFIEMVIPHHEGAIRMANKQLAEGSDARLQQISRAVVKAQAAEIAQMRGWLKRWYGPDS